ncbi:MAG: hypothetical protein WBH31_02335 [Promethearchaeia archaeon]
MDENEKALEMKEPSKKKMKLSSKIFIVMGIVGPTLTIIGTYITMTFWNTFEGMEVPVGLTLIGIGAILIVIVVFCALPRGCIEWIPV